MTICDMCMTREGVHFDVTIEGQLQGATLELCVDCHTMFFEKIVRNFVFLQYIREKILNDPEDFERFYNR